MPAPRGRVLGDLSRDEPDVVVPLLMRHINGMVMDGGRVRLIGLEIRLRGADGIQEEVKMVPLDIEVRGTANIAYPWFFGPLTLHTSAGDVQIGPVQIPASAF